MSYAEQVELDNEYVMSTFGRKPIEFVRGSGMMLEDDEGREYLDFLSGIGVVSLGHCAPEVVAAVSAQASELIHVGNYFYIEHRGEVAELLSAMLNDTVHDENAQNVDVWKSFFANSGAEANECAIKLARLYARKHREGAPNIIVTLQNSFHGRTLASLAATAQPAKQEAFEPLPQGFVPTPVNDIAALEQLFAAQGERICAVMLEPIQGESGVHPCTAEFLQAARKLTEEHGALLVCDEVQSGIYRTGKPFAFQHAGIVPDIVTIAKGVASGIPAAACAARAEVAAAFAPGDHGSTFGGSNIAMAAAHATLRAVSARGFGAHVTEVGEYLRSRLAEIPAVAEVRGMGLMMAADLSEDAPSAPDTVAAALECGLVLNATGPRTLRFLPPLICEKEHVDTMVARLASLL